MLSRIRAGVLEFGTVDLLHEAGVGARMDREGFVHDGTHIALQNRGFRIDFKALTGKQVMVYGQTEVTADLYKARDAMGGVVIHEAEGVTPHGLETDSALRVLHPERVRETHRLRLCRSGCDGFHGVSRKTIPASTLREYERVYPFGWLGVLSRTPPVEPRADLCQPPARLCAVFDAQREPQPLLHPGTGR